MRDPMKIVVVAGARPNFMKVAPLVQAMRRHPQLDVCLVHTGQHYDFELSKIFFDELGIPRPAYELDVGSASHAIQTAEIMKRFESVCLTEYPDLVVVVGDVNSTLACSLVAAKLEIRVAHVEAGLRSFDRRMPEEINRIVSDALADYLFTTEQSAPSRALVSLNSSGSTTVVKKRHGIKNNVLINMLCKICFLSDTVESKKHDKKLADETEYTLPDGSKLVQDTGFEGFTLDNVAILQPKKKPRGKSLSDLDKSINHWLSSVRVRIEHAIGGVKRYRIVKDKIRNWKPGFKDLVFETCCGLHNFRLNFRPWTYKPIQLHLFINF